MNYSFFTERGEKAESFPSSFFVTIFSNEKAIMDFDELVLNVLNDERVGKIPILFVIEVLIVVDELMGGKDV